MNVVLIVQNIDGGGNGNSTSTSGSRLSGGSIAIISVGAIVGFLLML